MRNFRIILGLITCLFCGTSISNAQFQSVGATLSPIAGDANADCSFDSLDMSSIFRAGTYETNVPALWSTGDFNGDKKFDSSDLILALATGKYETGNYCVAPRPEPFAGCARFFQNQTTTTAWQCVRAAKSIVDIARDYASVISPCDAVNEVTTFAAHQRPLDIQLVGQAAATTFKCVSLQL